MASDQVQVFLREIKEHPDDDTPRLVLADWLQDQGDPRGELMHLQVTRFRLSEDDPRYANLHRRERQILDAHALNWLGPLVDLVVRWEFRRGLIALEAQAGRLLGDNHLDWLEEDEILRWLEELVLVEPSAKHLGRLASSPLLGHLSILDLDDNDIADAGLARLLTSPHLSGLRELRLAYNRLGTHGATALANCAGLVRLQVLDLGGNRIGDTGARALAESPHLGNLRRLIVGGHGITRDGLRVLRERFGSSLALAPGRGG
jgi:uncharacterized protein (TIGR02996 family)